MASNETDKMGCCLKRGGGLIRYFLLAALLFTSFANPLSAKELIFGVIEFEGTKEQETSTSYKVTEKSIAYLNAYFKARQIDMKIYPWPQAGSFFETLDRLRKRKIDIAVFPPYIKQAAGGEADFKLLGILDYPRSWKAVLLCRADANISSISDLAKKPAKFNIVYVNEMSSPGYIIPKIYFTDRKILFKKEIFSEGHLKSIESLLQGKYEKNTVLAVDELVYDDFRRLMPGKAASLKKIFTLENPYVFKDCIFVNADINEKNVRYLKEAFDLSGITKIKDAKTRQELLGMADQLRKASLFDKIVTDVDERVFDSLYKYLSQYDFKYAEKFSIGRVLERIANDIDNKTAFNPGYRPKIAVVLSGGGASCSYQVGVLRALNEKLGEINATRSGKNPLSVDLIVGTSIGSFNAVFYAMNALDSLEKFWANIRSEDVITPVWLYHILKRYVDHPIIMMILTPLLFFSFFYIIRSYLKNSPKRKELFGGVIFPGLVGVILLLCGMIFPDFLPAMFFLVIMVGLTSVLIDNYGDRFRSLSVRLVIIILSAALIAYLFGTERQVDYKLLITYEIMLIAYLSAKLLFSEKSAQRFATILEGLESLFRLGFVILGVLTIAYLLSFLTFRSSIFTNEGYEKTFAAALNQLAGEKPGTDMKITVAKLLAQRSAREFVITAADLDSRKEVYFYHFPKPKPYGYLPLGPIWVSLDKNPEKMVDAVVASSAAVILFPVKETNINGRNFSLIDGGSLHVVPVDAATSLGATHLIIVLAGEDVIIAPNREVLNFFDHAYKQIEFSIYGSQILDYMAREKRMSFVIIPQKRFVRKQDYNGRYFKGKYITPTDFMEIGYNDALGKEDGFRELSAGEFILKGGK